MRLIEYFEVENYVYLVFQRMSQGDLQSLMTINKIPILSEKELQAHAVSLIKAVAGVHELGFTHNDIQPVNILA